MTRRSEHKWPLAAVTLLAMLAPSLGGEWCENFESGAGSFWSQRSYSGQWEHITYEDAKSDGNMPKPSTGETGMLLLRAPSGGAMASSRLVTPELVFSDGASIELTYWLWHSGAHSEVNFLLYRLVDGVEDRDPFMNVTRYSTKHSASWSTLEAQLNLDRGKKIRVAIYGYVAGNSAAQIALDRVILRNVNDDNACGEDGTPFPNDDPDGPEGPAFDFFCPSEYGLYLDPEDCHFYYSCNSWIANHMPCYTDLVFNQKTEKCDYLKYVPSCQV